jgi:hypothetical protein
VGLFGRKDKDKEVVGGLAGSAVVKSLESNDFWDKHATRRSEPIRLTDVGLGSYTFRLELEVHLDDGRAAYTVTDDFKVPAKAGAELQEGMTVPLHADAADQNTLDLDWDAFMAPGADGRRADEVDPAAIAHETMPDASRQQMVDGWVQGVRTGNMSMDDFTKAIDGAVGGGLLNAAEADAARQQLA